MARAAISVKESGWAIAFATGAGDFAPLADELAKPNDDRRGSPHRHTPAIRALANIRKK
jgi:hypothetical protein